MTLKGSRGSLGIYALDGILAIYLVSIVVTYGPRCVSDQSYHGSDEVLRDPKSTGNNLFRLLDYVERRDIACTTLSTRAYWMTYDPATRIDVLGSVSSQTAPPDLPVLRHVIQRLRLYTLFYDVASCMFEMRRLIANDARTFAGAFFASAECRNTDYSCRTYKPAFTPMSLY